MKYIIMADGKGTRWGDYKETPKHFIALQGEPLIKRTVRLLRDMTNEEIIITSHNPNYEFEGVRRHEPKNNTLEIDRFTTELISNECCFLYGDTYYTKGCLEQIVAYDTKTICFWGTDKSIIGIKVRDGDLFKYHINKVRNMYLEGRIDNCIGWQVYQSYVGIPIGNQIKIGTNFNLVTKDNFDINTPEDYMKLESMIKNETWAA